jgi:glycosyltransferase involved in cell wall biosynthesis
MSRPLTGVRIVRVGHHDPDYARNRILAKALRRAGAELVDLEDRRTFPRRFPTMAARLARLPFDLLLVGFPGHTDVPIAKLLAFARRRPVVFDPLVSLYETSIEDRQTVAPRGAGAARRLFIDRVACSLADLILVDTDVHRAYFVERLGIPTDRFARVWVGADDEVMRPREGRRGGRFRVFFYGSFIPLHGIEHILQAAHLLERSGDEVEFMLVGDGQTYMAMRQLCQRLGVRSVTFAGRRRYEDLPLLMADSHVCLGVFASTNKASRVIPNKAFDALAMARPLVTGDTPAAREVLVHGTHAWFCPPGDPAALADAIRHLRDDSALRTRLSVAGRRLFEERFSIDALSALMASAIKRVLES